MTVLLDANVLIALLVADHAHHDAAEDWLVGTARRFATCPITEGSLVRLLVREGQTAETTTSILSAVARAHDGRLATFGKGLAKLYDDIVDLIPTR